MVTPLVVVLLVLMGFMAALWSYSIRIRNGAVADVGWGLGFIIAAWLHLALASGPGLTAWIMAGVLTLWGFRLSLYIWRDRVAGGRPEDARYREFRDKWGNRADLNLFGFFQLQALLIVVVSLPMAVAAHDPGTGYGGFQAAGLLLWIAAFAGEVVSDSQLKNFKSRPENRGRVLDTGLWRHSRHPNYFFEWLLWVAMALMSSDAAGGWLGYISPILMLWLLTRVTGIPLAEAQSLRSRGDAFREYQATTSAFVPWFRKKGTVR